MLKDLSFLVSLCKRRGYIFPGSGIYGGLSACWDYGPLGVEFKRNVEAWWWRKMCHREDIVGLDSAILMHPRVWEASGHLSEFSDPLVDCRDCKYRFRPEFSAPEVQNKAAEVANKTLQGVKKEDKNSIPSETQKACPRCGSGHLTEPRPFHLMFHTQAGPLTEEADKIYLRPETAQGIYVNFLNISTSMRKKLPFGVAQTGKAFRNEITLGNFIFRCREFEQMEMQYFTHPATADKYFEYWKHERRESLLEMGIPENKLRETPHTEANLAHYAHKAVDLEFLFPTGWRELEGIHHRGDFDLKQHQKFSGKKLAYTDPASRETYIPYIIETSIGLDRLILALLCAAWREEQVKEEKRTLLALSPGLSPVQVALLPLQKKGELKELALRVAGELRGSWRVEYDESGSIGKRYRRQDEIGTPFCVTVDFDSLEDKSVTCRHRDTMQQDRLPVSNLEKYLADKIKDF